MLSGVATAAKNAHFLRSCVPKDPHLVGAAEGCRPQVRELGLLGTGNHVFRPLLAHSRSSPTWRLQKGLAFRVLRGSQAPRRAVCGTRGSLRTMHGGTTREVTCHPMNNWRGKQSSIPPHKTRPDSLEFSHQAAQKPRLHENASLTDVLNDHTR